MKNIKYLLLSIAIVLLFFTSTPIALLAEETINSNSPAIQKLYKIGGENGPYTQTGDTPANILAEKIGVVVNVLISLLGIIFISLALYAGYNYMMARGNDEKISKALATLQQAIIGLIITVSSYGIWAIIYNKLLLGQ